MAVGKDDMIGGLETNAVVQSIGQFDSVIYTTAYGPTPKPPLAFYRDRGLAGSG